MTKDEVLELPDDAQELFGIADVNQPWVTMNRAPDGTVYLVSWWYGRPTVLALVRPDGTYQKSEE